MKRPATILNPNFVRFLFPILAMLQAGCGAPALPEFHSLTLDQPYVVEASPPDHSPLQDPVELTLRFSERIDLSSLDSNSVTLLSGMPKPEVFKSASALEKALSEGEIPSIPLQYLLDSEERGLTLLPEAPLQPGVYVLAVTPKLRSVRGLPFNQRPGENPTAYLARFTYGEVPEGSLDPSNGNAGEGAGGPVFGAAPERLVIEELLYDGKVSDTDGENFVELYGTAGADISLYQILFLNGENGSETERITLPPGSKIPEDGIFLVADLRTSSTTASKVSGADYLDQFDPQNGPDGVMLLDREGHLLDSVVYGSGAHGTAENGLPLGEGAPAPDVPGGHSLSRRQGVDSQDNAADFVALATPSPGLP
ncbi:MAG: lamin tail domain-containing protein [bacterium]